MYEEVNGSIFHVIHLLFIKDHTWPEFLFLYFLVQIISNYNFKVNDFWDLSESLTNNKDATIFLLLFKPFFLLFSLLLPMLLVMLYVFILACIGSLIFEYLPNILPTFKVGYITVNGDSFIMPAFNIKKMTLEGSYLSILIYFFCYAGRRNKELSDLKKG